MKVAILFDAGSEEWSPQDVAAVVRDYCGYRNGNSHLPKPRDPRSGPRR